MEKKKFETKKSLGQHFLTSAVVPRWMCDAAEVTAGDLVLEIGPGTGVLTRELLLRGAHVVALEADARAIAVLQETFATEVRNGSLTVYHSDVRQMDLSSITELAGKPFKVVANIPYYLSGMLFRSMLESEVQPTDLVYLVQKEVAKRITSDLSRGEKESILSLSVKAFGTARYIKTVSKGHFSPPPKIDSAIIAVRNIHTDNFKDLDMRFFFELLHIGFGQKRKQLLGNLSKFYSREELTNIFSTLSIPLSTRAEDLSLEIWLTLAKSLQSLPNSQPIHR